MVNIRFILFFLLLPFIGIGSMNTVPFHMEHGLIIVEAEVNHIKGYFILDTGASDVLINQKVDNIAQRFITAHGETESERVLISSLKIGLLKANNIAGYAMDLSTIDKNVSVSISGILGGQAIYEGVIEIDRVNKNLIFHENLNPSVNRSRFIKYDIVDGVPVCRLSINKKEYAFILDSGASNHFFDNAFITQHKAVFSLLDQEAVVFSATSESIESKYSIKSLLMGNLLLHNEVITSGDFSALIDNIKICGLISLSKLSNSSLYIDTKESVIYF